MCGLSTVVTPAGASITMYREIRSYANSIWDDNNNNNYVVATPIRGLLDRKKSEKHLLIAPKIQREHENKNKYYYKTKAVQKATKSKELSERVDAEESHIPSMTSHVRAKKLWTRSFIHCRRPYFDAPLDLQSNPIHESLENS